MNREPPSSVRHELRREANFGCPVPGCGSPYLTYHHFDPPFHEHEHHNPEGMIALCTKHHPMADRGKWSKTELRQMKQNPFLQSNNIVDNNFGWRKRELILAAGGFYINPRVFLRLNGKDIIWCKRDEYNRLQLSIDIRDNNDVPIVLMESDDFLSINNIQSIKDIEISPGGHSLIIKAPSKGVELSLKFQEHTQQKLRELGRRWKMELDRCPGIQEPIQLPVHAPFIQEIILQHIRHLQLRDSEEWIREKFLTEAIEGVLTPMPSGWEILNRYVHEWPVTVCKMSLTLKYPFNVNIFPGLEDVGGWKAGHTLCIEPEVAWNIHG